MTEREQYFGADLLLERWAGALDLRPDRAGDLRTAFGNGNVRQALILRLSVRKGELAPLGWPGYGSRLHELIGEPNVPRTHVKLMAFARDAVEEDPRVIEVAGVGVRVLEDDAVRLDMEVRLIDEPDPLNLVYDLRLEAP